MQEDEVLRLVREYMYKPDDRMQRVSGYEGDRVGQPLAGRRGTFHRDFYEGYQANPMEQALERYTWSNLVLPG